MSESGIGISSGGRRSWALLGGLLLAVALLVLPARAGAWTALAVRTSPPALIPVDTASGQAGEAISLPSLPRSVAVTPDGRTAYVTMYNAEEVRPVDLASATVGAPIPVPGPPNGIAITPDGSRAYVTSSNAGRLVPIDLASGTAGEPILIGSRAWQVAIAPNGSDAYVTTGSDGGKPGSYAGVARVNLATRTVTTGVRTNISMNGLAITPDGAKVYAIAEASHEVFVLPTAPGSEATSFFANAQPRYVAINPWLSQAYATNPTLGRLTGLDVATDSMGAYIGVGGVPQGVAVTPDGATVVTANVGGSLSFVDVDSGSLGGFDQPARLSEPLGGTVEQLAIVPDAPTAVFSAAPGLPGEPSRFDGTGSNGGDGALSYAWSFGDGATATGQPVVEHTYAAPGTYTATLTVADRLGCTAGSLVFTGQTASCSGTVAQVEHQVVVAAPAPPPAGAAPGGSAPAPPAPTGKSAKSQPPSNAFKIRRIKLNRKAGTARLTLAVPGPGRVVLAGKDVKRSARQLARRGQVGLVVTPRPSLTRLLRRHGKAVAQVKVTYTPVGGRARTKAQAVRLQLQRRPRAKAAHSR